MKYRIVFLGIMGVLSMACSVNELDIAVLPTRDCEEFYATIEDASTKVFADEKLRVLWNADDRVSIFNKYTYNQEYRFTGEDGDNSGSFKKVPNDDFVTGNALELVYSVYPYKESTKISNDGIISVTLPAEQSYRENSFGQGANTMISATDDNQLLYKNLCGYWAIKLYGDNVSVTSITLKGNNDEFLAGKATVNASVNKVPSMSFDASATKEITLSFDNAVTLGTAVETATTFWIVVPPTVFSKGFTLTVKDNKNGIFEKSTTKSFEISRNKLARMSALNVTIEASQPNNEIWYTSTDERTIEPFGSLERYLTNEYSNGKGILTLYQELKEICDYAFRDCATLKSISSPQSVISIGYASFYGCSSLTHVDFPENLKTIGTYAFGFCSSLASVTLPEDVTTIDYCAFYNDLNLTDINIPKNLIEIGDFAFSECSKLTTVIISDKIQTIGKCAFSECTSLISIRCEATTPPSGRADMFHDTNNCPIYVPSQSVEAYKTAQYWSEYAHRIKPIQDIPSIPVPEAVDLGLSVKWASFNLGASKPEEYGDYYAWGETEPKDDDSWATYKWCMGSNSTMTKYCDNSEYGYNGFTDNKTVLDLEDDAAKVNLGGKWRMPTDAEWTELRENCTWTRTTQNGMNGRLVTASNGNSIFLPAAGRRYSTYLNLVGSGGDYWSSSLGTGSPYDAWSVFFNSGSFGRDYGNRCNGFSVRPVFAE